MDRAPRGLGLVAIERCADAWAELHARIGHRFARAEAHERAGRDLGGTSFEELERQAGDRRLVHRLAGLGSTVSLTLAA